MDIPRKKRITKKQKMEKEEGENKLKSNGDVGKIDSSNSNGPHWTDILDNLNNDHSQDHQVVNGNILPYSQVMNGEPVHSGPMQAVFVEDEATRNELANARREDAQLRYHNVIILSPDYS
jgi:hypothetical protein